MVRCLSLFGLMFFTMGVVALASVAGGPAALPARPSRRSDDDDTPTSRPRRLDFPAPTFHARFSLN